MMIKINFIKMTLTIIVISIVTFMVLCVDYRKNTYLEKSKDEWQLDYHHLLKITYPSHGFMPDHVMLFDIGLFKNVDNNWHLVKSIDKWIIQSPGDPFLFYLDTLPPIYWTDNDYLYIMQCIGVEGNLTNRLYKTCIFKFNSKDYSLLAPSCFTVFDAYRNPYYIKMLNINDIIYLFFLENYTDTSSRIIVLKYIKYDPDNCSTTKINNINPSYNYGARNYKIDIIANESKFNINWIDFKNAQRDIILNKENLHFNKCLRIDY